MLSAIIVAGGSSSRMGFDKIFAPLAGKLLIAHTIAAFQEAKCVDEIVIVCRPDFHSQLQSLVASGSFSRVAQIVRGGEDRQDSVRAGLQAIHAEAKYISVHDAARPLITPNEISRVFHACREHDAAVLVDPITDTVKRATADNFIADSVDRTGLFAMQTPQMFERSLLERAYREVTKSDRRVTDEVSAVQLLGHRVAIVSAQEPNLKITYPRDLDIAQLLLSRRTA